MEHKENLAELRRYFKVSNKRYTVERERLLELISSIKGRFSLADLANKARKRGYIHANSTLYRNIFMFIDAGFINEIKLCGGRNLYESNFNNDNNFLLCVGCGKLEKIEKTALINVREKICNQHGFESLNYMFQIKGFCHKCKSLANDCK